jgi:hypothetical protein
MFGIKYCTKYFRFIINGMCPTKRTIRELENRNCMYKVEIQKDIMSCCKCYCPCRDSQSSMFIKRSVMFPSKKQVPPIFIINQLKQTKLSKMNIN